MKNYILLFLKFISLVEGKAANDGLYAPEDYVHILTKGNFESSVKDESKFWVIEFYASWCGHCIHFAPTIKNFGIDVQNWSRLFNFGVVDCGNAQNSDICAENKISGFPTIKYYLPGPRNYTAPNHVDGRTMELIRASVTNLLSENKIPQKLGISTEIDFQDLSEKSDLENCFEIIKNDKNIKYFILIIGFKLTSHSLGFGSDDLIADFSTFENVGIRKSDESKEIAEHYSVADFPIILLINPETEQVLKSIQVDLDSDLPRARYTESISLDLDISPFYIWEISKNAILKSEPEIVGPDWSSFDQSKVYIQDIESAILSILFHDIITFPLEDKKLESIKNFVREISKIYPSTSRNVDMYLKNLYDNIENVSRIKKRKEWISELNQSGLTKLQGESPKLQYAACKPSVGTLRGYTCGLWTSFHFFITNSPEDSVGDLAQALANMILEHFKCIECRENFKNEIQKFPIETVTDQDSAIIWLWSLHNSVNARLAGDETEDPKFPKIQFPSEADCPKCRNDDGNFEEKEILDFMKFRYSVENFVFFENEKIIESNSERLEEDDDEEEIISPSKARIRPGWIWFIVVTLTVGLLFLWRTYRVKIRLRRSYRKFYHQL